MPEMYCLYKIIRNVYTNQYISLKLVIGEFISLEKEGFSYLLIS